MSLGNIVLVLGLGFVAWFIWRHLAISKRAYEVARDYSDKNNVQLLDQSVVLRRLRIRRSSSSLFALERLYRFEFSTIGDRRYKGSVVFVGEHLSKVEMEPFKVLDEV